LCKLAVEEWGGATKGGQVFLEIRTAGDIARLEEDAVSLSNFNNVANF